MATYSIASLSWIDPKTGLPEVDKKGDPGPTLVKNDVTWGRLYRFANLLEVQLDISSGAIQNPRFTRESGMYRGPSYMGLDSAPVGMIGRKIIPAGNNAVTFKQIVGCRTESPEKIGRAVGGAVGVGAGALGGAKVGAGIGTIGGLPGVAVGGVIGTVVGGYVGYVAGREVAELATAYPPIWTELELTVNADGSTSQRVISHSLFPSMTFYALRAVADSSASNTLFFREVFYDGVPNLEKWKKKGWGLANQIHRSNATEGNPWGMEDPGPVLGVGKMSTHCPSGYECQK